jgi:hypothetical protein
MSWNADLKFYSLLFNVYSLLMLARVKGVSKWDEIALETTCLFFKGLSAQ